MAYFKHLTHQQFAQRFTALLRDHLTHDRDKPHLFAVPLPRRAIPTEEWAAMIAWGEAQFGHYPAPSKNARWYVSGPDAHIWVAIRDEADALAFKMRWC